MTLYFNLEVLALDIGDGSRDAQVYLDNFASGSTPQFSNWCKITDDHDTSFNAMVDACISAGDLLNAGVANHFIWADIGSDNEINRLIKF
jgi:hypothetical protein